MNKKEEKTSESVTFRINQKLLKELRKEAEQKEISLNTLANQIFGEHIEWHIRAAKAGFISVRRGLLLKLMDKLPDQDVVSIAEHMAKRETKDFILLLRSEYSVTSALDVLETWIKISGYTYTYEIKDDMHSFIIQHDMGKKWSMYLAELFRFVAQEFGLKRIEFDISENTLVFKVDVKST